MKSRLLKFLSSDTGAVTIDWVVLTAAVISLTLLLISTLAPGTIQRGLTIVESAVISTNF